MNGLFQVLLTLQNGSFYVTVNFYMNDLKFMISLTIVTIDINEMVLSGGFKNILLEQVHSSPCLLSHISCNIYGWVYTWIGRSAR